MNEIERRRRERGLEADLAALPRRAAPRVDVRGRVLARIAGQRPLRPLFRMSGLALAASVALAACLGVANASLLPRLPSALSDAASATSGARGAIGTHALASIAALFAGVTELVSQTLGLVVTLLEMLEQYAWIWKPCLASAFAIACLAAGVILVREFKKAPRVNTLEENHHDA